MRARIWRDNHSITGVHSWDVEESGVIVLKDAKHNVLALVTAGGVVEFVEDRADQPVEATIVHTVG